MGNLARTAINQNKTIFKAGCSVGNPAQSGKGGLMKCRCHTELDYVKGGSTIVYCPLHAQAEAMLEALTEALVTFKSLHRNGIIANPLPIQRRLENLRMLNAKAGKGEV